MPFFGQGGRHDFSAPEPLPAASCGRVVELLASGRLFRYQGVDDVALLEKDFGAYEEEKRREEKRREERMLVTCVGVCCFCLLSGRFVE